MNEISFRENEFKMNGRYYKLSKDKYFKTLEKKVRKGIITFETDYIYHDNKSNNSWTVNQKSLTDVEKKIFENLHELSNMYESRLNREKIVKNETRFINKFLKEYNRFFSEDNVIGLVALYSVFIITILLLLSSMIIGHHLIFSSIASIINLIYPIGIPSIMILRKIKRIESNKKYQLSLEEYNKLQNNRKEDKKLSKAKNVLKEVSEENIPSLEEGIIRNLNEAYSLINKLDNKELKLSYTKELLSKIKDYKESKIIENDSQLDLNIVQKQFKSASLLVYLESLNRNLALEVNKKEVDKQLDFIENKLNESLEEGNSLTLKL